MPVDRANKSVRHRDQDQQRLPVTAEGNGQHGVHGEDGHGVQTQDLLDEALLTFGLPDRASNHTGEPLFPCREEVLVEIRHDVATNIFLQIGGNARRAIAVPALNALDTRRVLEFGHRKQWHLPAVSGPDPEILQALNGPSRLQGIVDHHLDVLPFTRQPLNLFAVVGLPHLAGHIGQRQAHLHGTRFQREPNLLGSALQVVADIVQRVIGTQLAFKLAHGFAQDIQVGVPDRKLEPGAVVVQGVLNGDFLGIGHIAHQFPQAQCRVLGADIATNLWRRQLDDGQHAVSTRTGIPVLDQLKLTLVLFVELFNQRFLGSLHLRQHLQRAAVRGTLRHDDIDVDFVRLDLRHKAFLDVADIEQPEPNNQQRNEEAGGQVAALDGPLPDATIVVVGKVDNAVGNSLLKTPEAMKLLFMPGFHVGEVGRQDPK